MPPALANLEDADHKNHDGAWRNMQCVEAGRTRNPTLTAKQQRDILRDYFVSPDGQVSW